MSDQITTTYAGIVITYDEYRDKWTFDLYGRERSAETLANAKAAIDTPPPKDKKPFEKQSAIFKNYQGTTAVEVTSIAETKGYSGRAQVWIKCNRQRQKVEINELFAKNPENTATLARIKELRLNKEELDKRISQ